MRSLSATLRRKIASRIQAGDNALSASLWVGRPTTPLLEDRFLEKQLVLTRSGITKTSIAVCHPRLMQGATDVYIGYLRSGVIKIAKTTYTDEMEQHTWEQDIGYSQEADDFCLCFDGTMPKAPNGKVEFKTEQMPWVFWVLDGALYGKKLFDNSTTVTLVESNCSAVSAVRAMWSISGGFDFGLVVFFVLSGQLFYRQLINGEWMDAEVVTFGPSGVSWEKIAAFRTWDYRIGIQGITTGGNCYEMFTEFMGIGKQNTEHVEISKVDVNTNFIEIQHNNARENEHIDLSEFNAEGGLWKIGDASIVEAYNIATFMVDSNSNEQYEDWGIRLVAIFDRHIDGSILESQFLAFALVDSRNITYTPSSVLLSDDKLSATFTFMNFNNANGECQFRYTPGTVKSMAGYDLIQSSAIFTPRNLVPSEIPVPEVENIWNE